MNAERQVHDTATDIDHLSGALQSDDDLVTEQELAMIDARFAIWEAEEVECLDWEMVCDYISSRPTPRTRSV